MLHRGRCRQRRCIAAATPPGLAKQLTDGDRGLNRGQGMDSGSDRSIDELGDAEELLKLAFTVNPSVTAISDAETGRFIEVSDGFCKTSGYRNRSSSVA